MDFKESKEKLKEILDNKDLKYSEFILELVSLYKECKLQERNCNFCDHYKDEYCYLLDMKPCYPEYGCDYFESCMSNIQEIRDEIKDLSERVETLEKKIIKEKEEKIEKLKAELNYAKFRCSSSDINIKAKRYDPWWWECERCGKLIPYMANYCHECADKILKDPPKPFNPQIESENEE